MRITSIVLLLLTARTALAQAPDPAAYERVLLPISFSGVVQGGYGTAWDAEVLMYNDGSEPVDYLRSPCPLLIPSCGEPGSLAGGHYETMEYRGQEFIPGPGSFIYVEKAGIERVRFAALLRDRSRADENAGTEMPVVRERDYAARVVLPYVPLPRTARAALRIYGPGEGPLLAQLRIYRLDRSEPLVDTVVPLQGIVTAAPNLFPYQPAYVQFVDLRADFPQLGEAESLRIEIGAIDENIPLWGFVSVTNLETQVVTTVTPQ